jgi:hypothetical protein
LPSRPGASNKPVLRGVLAASPVQAWPVIVIAQAITAATASAIA